MKQYDIATLVGLRCVCFQVNAETSKEFQRAFFEHCGLDQDNTQEAWQVGFIGITDDGKINFSCRPNYDNEQVILAPEKFNSQKELMQFLVMGGEVWHKNGQGAWVNSIGNIEFHTADDDNWLLSVYDQWKPRIDKQKPKWFPAWASDHRAKPNRDNSNMFLLKESSYGGNFVTQKGESFDYATPLTDSELAEFGLKRIENDA